MSFEKKHLECVENFSIFENKIIKMLNMIQNDSSGSCWDIENVKSYTLSHLEILKKLSKDDLIQLPFFGLTVGMKDLFCIKGLRTTAGSKMLENFISPYDSNLWNTLKNKGSLLGGKLSMDEFAMGSFSNTSSFGKTSLPGFPDRTAGGSSGGSGSAMAAKLFDFTVGSDTGGSVRLPASFCSVIGYKPSYGTFSRHGMISYASSLDQAGLFTESMEDLKYIMSQNISTKDLNDTTSTGLMNYQQYKSNKTDKKDIVVGFFPEIMEKEGIQEDVKKAYQKTISQLKDKNIILKPMSIPLMDKAAQIYYIIACAEASSNLARYQGIYFGKQLIEENFNGSFWEQCSQLRAKYFGLEVQKRIMIGSFMLSSENFGIMFEKAKSLRNYLTQSLENVLLEIDCLILPVSPMVAPKWEDISKMTDAEIYMSDFLTVPFSLAGLPAISTPEYKNEIGLGIGMQWVGGKHKDYQLIDTILKIKKKD